MLLSKAGKENMMKRDTQIGVTVAGVTVVGVKVVGVTVAGVTVVALVCFRVSLTF